MTDSTLQRHYAICLGNEGYEAMHEIPDDLQEAATLAALKGHKYVDETGAWLSRMSLRMRFNSHRDIKTYLITIDIEPDLMYKMLQANEVQDLIKEKGVLFNL